MPKPSFAERLGYGADDRLLIINCDDLGSSHSANVGTLRSMSEGVATSATLMVPCPWAREAARMSAGRSIGVHLTLTCEYPGYRWRGLTGGASLLDEEGFMPATTAAAVERVEAAEARAECRAQIETARSWGVEPTHLDAHMFAMQARADLFEVMLDLAKEYRLPVRMLGLDDPIGQGAWGRQQAEARGVLFNEYMISHWPRPTRDVLFEKVPTLSAGVTEIFAHPVADGDELRAYDPDNPDIRVHDVECLTDPAVAELLDRHGIKLISFREIRELQRAGG
jgi:chitin disaccharide deacetylase